MTWRFSQRALDRMVKAHKKGDVKALRGEYVSAGEKALREELSYLREQRKKALAYKRHREQERREIEQKQRFLVKMREREEKQRLARIEADRLEEERERKAMLQEEIQAALIVLIKDKKITVTAKFMKSIKDPVYKQQVVEAVCLSNV